MDSWTGCWIAESTGHEPWKGYELVEEAHGQIGQVDHVLLSLLAMSHGQDCGTVEVVDHYSDFLPAGLR